MPHWRVSPASLARFPRLSGEFPMPHWRVLQASLTSFPCHTCEFPMPHWRVFHASLATFPCPTGKFPMPQQRVCYASFARFPGLTGELGPAPPRCRLIHHFGQAQLCRVYIKHNDPYQPSCYQVENIGFCRASDLKECKFTSCQIAVPCWVTRSCCNVLSPTAPVHAGTKTKATRVSTQFSQRLANSGAWQGS